MSQDNSNKPGRPKTMPDWDLVPATQIINRNRKPVK